MNKTQENAQTGKYTADKLDMRATLWLQLSPVQKEAFITIIAYLVFCGLYNCLMWDFRIWRYFLCVGHSPLDYPRDLLCQQLH